MHVRGLVHMHRHKQESGEYPNIIAIRRNYSYASISSDRYQ